MQLLFYSLVFLYGITIGSFLNVCIYRIPRKENMITTRSHCMSCGYRLAWYDLVPLFSYLFLGGRCRKCGERISLQYPFVEALNGLLWLAVFYFNGINLVSCLYCVMASALLVLSVIDFRTYEIPAGINWLIGILGLIRVVLDSANWYVYVIGFFSVSSFLLLLYFLTKGRGIGGGDIKLMASAGLLLGWQRCILALAAGCLAGSVLHLIRMKVSKADRVLALGPYLSVGIFLAALFGDGWMAWYLSLCLG